MIDLNSCLKYFSPSLFLSQLHILNTGGQGWNPQRALSHLCQWKHSQDMFLPLCQESQLLANPRHQLQLCQWASPVRPIMGELPDEQRSTQGQQQDTKTCMTPGDSGNKLICVFKCPNLKTWKFLPCEIIMYFPVGSLLEYSDIAKCVWCKN